MLIQFLRDLSAGEEAMPQRSVSQNTARTEPIAYPSTRRDFLKTAGAAAMGLPLLAHRAWGAGAPSCIVIGAGLSGLAAAYELRQRDWNVTVLEARGRVGGRVFSYSFPQNPQLVCELGAEWIGDSHQRMQALCRDFNLPLQEHRFPVGLMRDGVVEKPGQWHFSAPGLAATEKFKGEFRRYTPADNRRLDSYDWWTWLQKIGLPEDDLEIHELIDRTEFGESPREVSAYLGAADAFDSSATDEMDYKITGGNSLLPHALAARIGESSVRTNSPVTAIEQRAGRVRVRVAAESLEADACICTIPCRLLSRIQFDPPLPAAHAAAAEKLQYARIVKNCVLFTERFWGPENFTVLTDTCSDQFFHSTQKQPGKEGILCSYAVGDKSDVLMSQDDQRRLDDLTHDLLPISARAPQLARAVMAQPWPRDQWTPGAYAIYKPGQWFALRPLLRQPHGKVLFAGEHLADTQGFMEGAVETGQAAARELAGGAYQARKLPR
jgi:monoamine oxidase